MSYLDGLRLGPYMTSKERDAKAKGLKTRAKNRKKRKKRKK